jgi:flagellar hook-associated protein 3 FlgL
MRIGSLTIAQQGLSSILDAQARLARAQQQLSSGRKDLTAADNPIDVSRALNLDAAIDGIERYKASGDMVLNRLGLEDNALADVGDVLQRVRELAVQANNATQSDASRQMIVTEMRQRLQQLVGIANAGDGQGRYLFAGTTSATAPFSQTGAGVTYGGDATNRQIAIGPNAQVADGDNGRDVFMAVRTGNGTFTATATAGNAGTAVLSSTSVTDSAQWDGDTYSINFTSATTYEVRDSANVLVTSGAYASGQSIAFRGVQVTLEGVPATADSFSVAPGAADDMFSIVEDMITALSIPSTSASGTAARLNGVFNGLQDLDQALDHLLTIRAGVGSRMNTVQDAQASQDGLSLQLEKARSQARDTDFATTVSQLQLQLTALQAAQQSFAKVQGLSLFDYLR